MKKEKTLREGSLHSKIQNAGMRGKKILSNDLMYCAIMMWQGYFRKTLSSVRAKCSVLDEWIHTVQ